MDVFCCCSRGQSNQDDKNTTQDEPVMPLPPPPAMLPMVLPLNQPPISEPLPATLLNQSKCSLHLATPIPGAPLEPVEMEDLVIDDSESETTSPQPKKGRASSTLHFVKSHLRKHMSEDSLRRQSRATVGSSTEELARRAELRRLMRKRIQEELQTDDSRDMDSDAPSAVLRSSGLPPHFDQLPGKGPRDNLEFSVVEAVDDTGSDSGPSRTEISASASSSPDQTSKPKTSAAKQVSLDSRRVSCPDYMTAADHKNSLRPASRAALRDRRNSLPPLSSSSHSVILAGSSATGSSIGSLMALGNAQVASRQAVTAVVVNGRISPQDIKRQRTIEFKETTTRRVPICSNQSTRKEGAYSKSRARSPPVADTPYLDQSPMKTWLRCQQLCTLSGPGSEHDRIFAAHYDGPSDTLRPKDDCAVVTQTTPLPVCTLGQARDDGPGALKRDPSEAQDAAVLRGGALGDSDCSHVGSSDCCSTQTSSPPSSGQGPHGFGLAVLSRRNIDDGSVMVFQPGTTYRNSISVVDFATRLLQPFSHREPSGGSANSNAAMVQANTSTASLPLPSSGTAVDYASSGAVSEVSSYRRRETELLSIPKRFASRHRAALHSSSRFREEFEESHEKNATRKSSLLTRLHLALPRRAKLASRASANDIFDHIKREPMTAHGGIYSSGKKLSSSRGSIISSPLRSETVLYYSGKPERTEDAWRRAIRAEADERRSLACGSSKRSSLRSPSPSSFSMEGELQPSIIAALDSKTHRARYSGVSEVRASVTQQQYEYDGFLKSLKGSADKTLEDWLQTGHKRTHIPSSRASDIPESWAKFPSHTRQERNGPAGVDSHVAAKDFAVKADSVDGMMKWCTDQNGTTQSATATTSAKNTMRGSRVLSGRLGKLMKLGFDKLTPAQDGSQNPTVIINNSERGLSSSSSSSQVLSRLEYSELQIQLSLGGFRELQALKHEIKSLKSRTSQHSRQLSAEANEESTGLPGLGSNFGTVVPDAICSAKDSEDSSAAVFTGVALSVEETPKPSGCTIAPATPNNSRMLPDQYALLMSTGSSTSGSEVFVTPTSQISERASPSSAATKVLDMEITAAGDGPTSARSSYTVTTGTRGDLGTEAGPSVQMSTGSDENTA